MDLKICSLERHAWLWFVSWQSLETCAKIISVTSISILYSILFVTRALVSQNGGGDGRAQERVFNLLPQEQPPHLHPWYIYILITVSTIYMKSFLDISAVTQKANRLPTSLHHTANEGPVRIQYKGRVPIMDSQKSNYAPRYFKNRIIMFCLPNFHICMYLWVIYYSHHRSAKDRWWEYINCSQIHECRNWEQGCAVSLLGIYVSNFWYSAWPWQNSVKIYPNHL